MRADGARERDATVRRAGRQDALCGVLILLAALGLWVLTAAPVFALVDPHFGTTYPSDTDVCAECHRGHTATGEFLIVSRFEKNQCFTCHDTAGTGSTLTVEPDFSRAYRHSVAGQYTKDETVYHNTRAQCSSCHEAHHMTFTTSTLLVDPLDTRASWQVVTDLTSPSYTDALSPSGLFIWCEQCHSDSFRYSRGDTITAGERSPDAFVPYDVNVMWQTSRSSTSSPPGVDESGTTTGYWRYFTAETTSTRYGYNDTSAAGNSSHGMATLSATAAARLDAGPATSSWSLDPGFYAGYPALPCTYCHDHHGSDQPWMIVETVTAASVPTGSYDMATAAGQKKFCNACHSSSYADCDADAKCTDCHRHGRLF